MLRRLLPLIAGTLLLLAVPASASAATLCVGFASPAGCDTSYEAAELQDALTAAGGNAVPDTVRIAAGTYAGSFSITSSHADIIEGAGVGATTLQSTPAAGTPADDTAVLSASGAAAPSRITVRDLFIDKQPSWSDPIGVVASNVSFDRVRVRVDTSSEPGMGIVGRDVDVRGSTIEIDGNSSAGVAFNGAGTILLEDSRIVPLKPGAGKAALVDGASRNLQLRRVRIGDAAQGNAFQAAVRVEEGAVLVEDTFIDLGPLASAVGVDVVPVSSTAAATVRRVTFAGTGTSQAGLSVRTDSAGDSASVTVEGSAFGGLGGLVRCTNVAGTVTAATMTASAYESVQESDTGCTFAKTGNFDAASATEREAWFVRSSQGDYRPRAGSALVDTGVASPSGITGDVNAAPRIVDGNGDGTARHDIGAFEYQRIAPTVTAQASTTTPMVDGGVTFAAGGVSDADGDAVAVTSWSFGDGGSATASSPRHVYLAAGTYTATVVVTDAGGRTASSSIVITVRGSTAADPDPPPDVTAPRLTLFAPLASLRRAATGFASTTLANRRALRLVLSERATLRITLARKVGTRFTTLRGSQSLTLAAGARRVTWGGRWRGVVQPLGSYRVTMRPVDAATNAGAARSVLVTLARR